MRKNKGGSKLMKSAYQYRVGDPYGFFNVVDPENPLMQYVHMDYIRLKPGQACQAGLVDRELCIALLSGHCRVSFDSVREEIHGRESLFEGLPHAVYIPPGKEVTVEAKTFFEAVVWGTPADPGGSVELVRPEDIRILHLGEGNWEIQGYFLIDADFPAQKLIVGETQIPKGNWCSVPPHSHEKDRPGKESKLEEIYLFRFEPSSGFGFQGLYTDDRELDDAYIIRNNDVVLIPRGYHPNVAGPGYQMRMMWGMGGLERNWIPFEDPEHAWIGEHANAPSDAAWNK
jgi:5-deoxy-glucuronate isomerase